MPAPDVECIVAQAIRDRLGEAIGDSSPVPTEDRDLIESHVGRIVIWPQEIEIHLHGEVDGNDRLTTMTVPWSATPTKAVKGLFHSPPSNITMSPENRDALLTAIAKARVWIDDLVQGRAASFAEIAEREGRSERYIRLLAPLAFVSPRVIAALTDGTSPVDLTVTELARALPHSWSEQERWFGLSHP